MKVLTPSVFWLPVRLYLVAVVGSFSGCCCMLDGLAENYETTNRPPHIESVNVPDPPIIGPDTNIRVEVFDFEGGLRSIQALFTESVEQQVSGRDDVAFFYGRNFSEGIGEMRFTVTDVDGSSSSNTIDELIVDLSPPTLEIGPTTLAGDEELEVRVADAWALGSVELRLNNTTLVHEFPNDQSTPIGETWDEALVYLSLSEAENEHPYVEVVAFDAAGNSIKRTPYLTIDGASPTVVILSPEPESVVTGEFTVIIEASDNLTEFPTIVLYIGEDHTVTASGPRAEIALHASVYDEGDMVLSAEATDEVGNVGVSEEVTITVVHSPPEP